MKRPLLILLLLTFILVGCKTEEPMPISPEIKEETEDIPVEYRFTDTMSFYHYEGLGLLTISSNNSMSVDILINDQLVSEIDQVYSNKQVLDIGHYTINGDNHITYTYQAIDPIDIDIQVDYPTLTKNGRSEYFTEEELYDLSVFMDSEIENGFPGAVLLIAQGGQVVYHEAFGYKQKYNGSEEVPYIPMTTDTLFDLASLTKAYSGALSSMKLVNDGLLSLETPINDYNQDYNSQINLGHLLSHTSGMTSYYRFFDPKYTSDQDNYSINRTTTMSYIPSLDLAYEPGKGQGYSDIGYMALTDIIEKASGLTLDQYAKEHIYDPLNLSQTLYKPYTLFGTDVFAATERNGNTRDLRYEWPDVRTHTLIGEVHDELCYYSMNEVSAHAGLFSTADEVAIMAQTLLNRGGYGDLELVSRGIVDSFTSPSTYYDRYGYGFDIASHPRNYYRYGLLTSDSAYGKTGWTGTISLIDPEYDLVVVLLTNKRHAPYEDGNFITAEMEAARYGSVMTRIYEHLLDQSSSYIASEDKTSNKSTVTTGLGIDQFDPSLFDNQSVGLICNTTSMSSNGMATLDTFNTQTNLTAVFAPEHGLEAQMAAGEQVTDSTYDHLDVYSLYGSTKKPTSNMLADIDVMAFDIQDVGVRYYTYIYTMIYSMEACAENNIPFVVYDRPNIMGEHVFGNAINEDYSSFIGDYNLHTVYGLTIGELAHYINDTYDIGCDLTVVEMSDYYYQYYEDTGIEFIAPSPNMRTLDTALLYPGTCLIEGTNLSEGRGTDYPFQTIGAPFINPYRLADTLNELGLEGVEIIPTSFIPHSSKHTDKLCYGVHIKVVDPYVVNPIEVGIGLMYTLEVLYGNDIEYRSHLNALAGLDLIELLEDETSLEDILNEFVVDKDYLSEIDQYRLYK